MWGLFSILSSILGFLAGSVQKGCMLKFVMMDGSVQKGCNPKI
jgi:hypothetical protein